MEFKKIADELEAYASANYKAFTLRFPDRGLSDEDNVWSLRANNLNLYVINVEMTMDTGSILLSVEDDDAFEELKKHADYIKRSYSVTVGHNPECSCKLIKDGIDWDDADSRDGAFDWIIMNAQMLQDIVDRYLSAYEAKETQRKQKISEFLEKKRACSGKEAATTGNYETKKVFAQTNARTGVRYKIIHRKSQNRHEIWTYDHGKRNRINNSEVEKIKHDKDAMIQYVKDNLLK